MRIDFQNRSRKGDPSRKFFQASSVKDWVPGMNAKTLML
jgi:hypothetical protein